MTKDQELAILDKAIAALGKDTYCGPWLANVRHEVEQSLRSDIFPDFSLREARVECAELKKQAAATCEAMRVQFVDDIKRLQAEARKKADDIATGHATALLQLESFGRFKVGPVPKEIEGQADLEIEFQNGWDA